MSGHLYIEGGESKEDQIRCRQGFRRILEKTGFVGRMPRLTACGGRNSAFDDFNTAHANSPSGNFVAMLIDSEEPVPDIEKPWDHLLQRDRWTRPVNASDDQALFMMTCMETWIVADRAALREHYGQSLQENALPPLDNLESRSRRDVLEKLTHATRNCANRYARGRRSYQLLEALHPQALMALPGFARAVRILKERL